MERLLLFVSPAESLADAFPSWQRLCYDGLVYRPHDMNMPRSIPWRPPSVLSSDPPLTEHGEVIAQLTGKAIRLAGIQPVFIWSSPELHCVQTAGAIAKALDFPCYVCVENGLQSWSQQFSSPLQPLLPRDFSQLGLPVYEGYRPVLGRRELSPSESFVAFSKRIRTVSKHLIDHFEGPSIMLADPAVLLLAQSQSFRQPQDLLLARSKLRPCSVTVYNANETGQLEKKENAVMPVTGTYAQAKQKEKSV